MKKSSIEMTHIFQLRSCGLTYRMPARDTVAGVAFLRWLISNTSLIEEVSGILSLLAKVSTWTEEKAKLSQCYKFLVIKFFSVIISYSYAQRTSKSIRKTFRK